MVRQALLAFAEVGEVDHHQRVVHHHARQRHDAEHARNRQIVPHYEVAQKRAHNAERNAQHDHQRLGVAPERNGQHRVDRHQGQDERDLEASHALADLRLVPFKRIREPRTLAQEFGQHVLLKVGEHFPGAAARRDVGRHFDHAAAVAAINGGVGSPAVDLGDLAERHIGACGRPDHQRLDRMLRRAFVLGQAHHHLDLVPAPLLAQHLGPIERIPHLPGNIARRQPQALAFRLQRKVELFLAGLETIVHVVHAGVRREDFGQLAARLFEHVNVAVAELDRQRPAPASRPAGIRREPQVFHARNLAHGRAPPLREFRRAHDRFADVGLGEFDAHPPRVAPRHANVGRDRHHQLRMTRLRNDLLRTRLKTVHDGFGLRDRRAVRQDHLRVGIVRFDDGKLLEAHPAAQGIRQAQRKRANTHRDRDVPVPQRIFQRRAVVVSHPVQKPAAERLLFPVQPALDALSRPVLMMRQLRGQNVQALDQRDHKNHAHHHGDHLKRLANVPRNEINGHEPHNIRQHAEDDRRRDFPCAANRRLDERQAFLMIIVDVLAHHDVGVHHDPQRDDEAEQRHHVDRHVARRKKQKRAHERYRHAHHDPERQARFQEHAQQHQYQHQPQDTVLDQQIDALAVGFGAIMMG